MDECPLYSEPELYDLLFPGAARSAAMLDDVRRRRIVASEQFYLEEARRSGSPVLEVACGSGRLTIPIAQAGVEVTGVDLSPDMLAAGRVKAEAAGVTVRLVQADMRDFDLGEHFAAILLPGNSLLHLLAAEDLKACFAAVRRHLGAGGRFIFDVAKWDLNQLVRDPAPRYPVMTLQDPRRGEITIEETGGYDAAEQIRHVVWYVSAPGAPDFRVIEYRLRVIFPQELLLLIEMAGFRLEERYGEFTREPFGPESPRQVCICR
jgi:SAM-dependent methyltransferase